MMKKVSLVLFLTFCCLTFISAQTAGELDVSVVTKSAGGKYSPRNVVAIWITNEDGNFIKTLLAYANKRKTHLNNWESSTNKAGSAFNTVDAITGATQSSHATRTCKWDGKDYVQSNVPDGKYYLNMELTDKNATGNYSSIEFVKSASSVSYQPTDTPSFTSLQLNWTPKTTAAITANMAKKYTVYPNPGNGIFHIVGNNIREIKITNIEGKQLLKSNLNTIDLSGVKNGVYFFHIENDKNTIVKKVIKK